jgi:hypothetical protein
MANIKFSQFTVGNVQSDIDFVVGYKGGDNIQISPQVIYHLLVVL